MNRLSTKLKFTERKHFLKILAVLLAILAWLYVVGSAQVKMDKSVKVEYRLPEHMALSGNHFSRVVFSIKGPRGFVKALRKRDDKLLIDVEKVYENNVAHYRFDVKKLGMDFPFGVEIERVEPSYIDVSLDRKISRTVPVKLKLQGELSDNHELVQSSFEPQVVTVTGAQSTVERLEQVMTEPVQLSQLKGSGEDKIALAQSDQNLALSTKSVKFRYEVRSTRSNLMLRDIPITFMTTQLVRHANRRSVSIMVLALDNAPKELDRKQVRVIADIPAGAKGQIKVELKAQLPDGYELMEIAPKQISVTIE